MTDEQIYKIQEKTEWDEERRKWKIPPFIIKQKEIQLPKLGNAKQFIQEELDNQDIVFTHTGDSNAFFDNTGPYVNHSNQMSAAKRTKGDRDHSRESVGARRD
jgi:hypothetical protein